MINVSEVLTIQFWLQSWTE